METWHIIAAIGTVLIILEIFTPSFFMLPAGVAFLVTSFFATWVDDRTTLLGILAALLLVVYSICYRFIWPKLNRKIAAAKTGVDAMVGKTAVVSEAITPDGMAGYVKLYGDVWRALADEAIEVGARVTIIRTDGNKVIVAREG